MKKKFTFFIDEENSGKRLDLYLSEQFEQFSRAQIKHIINEGFARINKRTITEFGEKLNKKEQLTVEIDLEFNYPKFKELRRKTQIEVLYEDNDIVVIDKSSGVLSVPYSPKQKDTAMHLIGNYFRKKQKFKNAKVYAVHRLDQATSGLIVYALNEGMQEKLKQQFIRKKISRRYIAIVQGQFKDKQGKLVSYLEDSKNDYKMIAKKEKENETDIEAITNYKVREEYNRHSLVEFKLETGKRNQIRSQFASIGHPVLGDSKYTDRKRIKQDMPQLALHAFELEFLHPRTEKKMKFSSRMPKRMREFIDKQK